MDNQKIQSKLGIRDEKKSEFEEKVVQVDRVSRTVKGGKRIRFRALVVVGNRNGKVGAGIGKGQEVVLAVKKAVNHAKKSMIEVPILNETIPHEIRVDFGGAKLYLAPAGKGTSIVAGGSVRSVLELVGIKNILSKMLGSSNKINNVKATILALKSLRKREPIVAKTPQDNILNKENEDKEQNIAVKTPKKDNIMKEEKDEIKSDSQKNH